jgi:hypothetical protein
MSGINVVFACTPRGVLNTCYRCRNRMRTCKCFEVRAPPLAGPGLVAEPTAQPRLSPHSFAHLRINL